MNRRSSRRASPAGPRRRRPTLDAATKLWRVDVARTHRPLALRAKVARTWRERMVGLLGHARLADGEALIFQDCNSIHTMGMRFAIDVVFVDRDWTVVDVREALGPGRLIAPVWSAWGVIEAAAGASKLCGLQVGDTVECIDASH